jgi:hypothetical protein
MILQHLSDHLLRLLEMAGLRSLIDLLRRRIDNREAAGREQQPDEE